MAAMLCVAGTTLSSQNFKQCVQGLFTSGAYAILYSYALHMHLKFCHTTLNSWLHRHTTGSVTVVCQQKYKQLYSCISAWWRTTKNLESLRHTLAVNSTLCSVCTGPIWVAKTALSACERWRVQLHCSVTVSNVLHSWKQTVPPVLEAHSAIAQQIQQTLSAGQR